MNRLDVYDHSQVKCFEQIEAINDHGCYKTTAPDVSNESLDRYIQLELSGVIRNRGKSGNEAETSSAKWSLNDLNNLSSRMILITRKGDLSQKRRETEIDRYLKMLEGIVLMTRNVARLREDGDLFYEDWEAEVHCKASNSTHTIGVKVGRSSFTFDGDPLKVLPELGEFMEDCITQWKSIVNKSREEYPELNVYTIKQINLMRKQLSCMLPHRNNARDCQIPGETNELLGLIISRVNNYHLADTISRCVDTARRNAIVQSHSHGSQINLKEFDDYLKHMMQYDGVTDMIAKASYQACEGNIDEGESWCIEHIDMGTDEVEEMYQKFKETAYADVTDVTSDCPLTNATWKTARNADTDGKYQSSLVKRLQQTWMQYQEDQTMLDERGTDHLSIELFGLLLRHLVKEESAVVEISSSPLSTTIIRDRPNFFIAPVTCTFRTCISLYCHQAKLLRPEAGDVLICSKCTTAEEIDLFLKRALMNSDGLRMFCLCRPEVLPSHICQFAVEKFHLYSHGTKRYRCTIVCSEASLASSFGCDVKDIQGLNLISDTELQSHMLSLLREDSEYAASVVDPQRMCLRIVKSSTSGNGKSFFVDRIRERAKNEFSDCNADDVYIKIPVSTKSLDYSVIAERLIDSDDRIRNNRQPRIYHIDISPLVDQGVSEFLFRLVVLKVISDSKGRVWKRRSTDLYLIETTSLPKTEDILREASLNFLPTTYCLSPSESLQYIQNKRKQYQESDVQSLVLEQFASESFQRVHHYLQMYEHQDSLPLQAPMQHKSTIKAKLKAFLQRKPKEVVQASPSFDDSVQIGEREMADRLSLILRHTGSNNPSWAVINQFVKFFNYQLISWETNPFCDNTFENDLPGFRFWVMKSQLYLSQDFATPSLSISDKSVDDIGNSNDDIFKLYSFRRQWETKLNPHIIFDKDGECVVFHGFNVKPGGTVVSCSHPQVPIPDLKMHYRTRDALISNNVNVHSNFDTQDRITQLEHMRVVLGLKDSFDPDPDYQLTVDSVTKMIAILMRFRCSIPVLIMGDTGCGKTRLVQFLCRMMAGRVEANNFIVLKVHGGTTFADIETSVQEAEEIAKQNEANDVDTVLFFDEANTTEAVGLIKEVMIDRTVNGRSLTSSRLKFVAACNPYRMLPKPAIKKLEAAGLGFRIHADDSKDKLGVIPLRHLVYRVYQLPPSLISCVWDFGTLSPEIEYLYISSMVRNKLKQNELCSEGIELLINVIAASHQFMRNQEEECRFVSLRDVERVIEVFKWMYQNYNIYGSKMVSLQGPLCAYNASNSEEPYGDDDSIFELVILDDEEVARTIRAVILTMGVCYLSSLVNRQKYRDFIDEKNCFNGQYSLGNVSDTIKAQIESCHDVFMDQIQLNPNIAKNDALKENVFMIIICLELRIPIFLIGKPGSSKSLAKTIVDNNMKGIGSSNQFFRNMKLVQMWSCQCSQHTTPQNIIETFNQCAKFQKEQLSDGTIGVVVLDEVGLAEDSPLLPLKTLHPLLESGCAEGSDTSEKLTKVGFIGMSNWALDPAKMNRGIFVIRDVPSREEIKHTARQISASAEEMETLIEPMSEAYAELFEKCKTEREYYGLRDFYGLIKMLSAACKKTKEKPTWEELKEYVCRNFDGHKTIDAISFFETRCKKRCRTVSGNEDSQDIPKLAVNSNYGLVCANLKNTPSVGETRYLLLMTKNSAGYDVIWHLKADTESLINQENTIVIYGSPFKRDEEYTQVCRNIRRIKISMETGQTVVLMNAENLYESLYDTMNQYYFEYGERQYVNLGLGTHRCNALVDKNFRLIIAAERDIVIEKYPIPLINRLEKHFLTFDDILTPEMKDSVRKLTEWTHSFVEVKLPEDIRNRNETCDYTRKHKREEVFIGIDDDTISKIVHDAFSRLKISDQREAMQKVLQHGKNTLIHCCTPDAIARIRMTSLQEEEFDTIEREYQSSQQHISLAHYLKMHLERPSEQNEGLLAQVTTHGKLLLDSKSVSEYLMLRDGQVHLVSLQRFTSEEEIRNVLKSFYNRDSGDPEVLLLQYAPHKRDPRFVPFVRFLIQDERCKRPNHFAHVVLILQLSRSRPNIVTNLQVHPWVSMHIDDLQLPSDDSPDMCSLVNKPLSGIFSDRKSDVRTTAVIKMCFLDAIARLEPQQKISEETIQEDNSSTKLVPVLECLLQESTAEKFSDSLTFSSVLAKRIGILLQRRETEDGNKGASWAFDVLFSASALTECGTFRRTLALKLVKVVTPILAELISYMDRNNGLRQLMRFTPLEWQHQLWLAMFSDENLTTLNNEDVISGSVHNRIVPYKGEVATSAEMKLPFSWIIYEKIQELIKTTQEGNRLWSIFESGPMGKVLKKVIDMNDGVDKNTLLNSYLHDFVQLVYKSSDCREFEIVYHSIRVALQSKERSNTDGTSSDDVQLPNLTLIHTTYDSIEKRIQRFKQMVDVMPHLLEKLGTVLQENEMTIDIDALRFGLELVLPDKAHLGDPDFRSKWINQQIPGVSLVAQEVFQTQKETSYGPKCLRMIKGCRTTWQALSVIRLFIKHLSPPEEPFNEKDVKIALAFFKVLQNDKKQLSKAEHMVKIQRLLKTCNKNSILRCFGVTHCAAGKHDVVDPVWLFCGHLCCAKCFNVLTARPEHQRKCPMDDCQKELPVSFLASESPEIRLAVKKLKEYRRRCNTFFLELVSLVYLQDDKAQTEKEVFDNLFRYVIAPYEDLEGENPSAPSRDVDIESTLPVRSFILRRLLKCCRNEVEHNLQRYFEEPKELEEQTKSIISLSILYVHCIEDSPTLQTLAIDDVRSAWKRMQGSIEIAKTSNISSFGPDDLNDVAVLRRFLTNVAATIQDNYRDERFNEQQKAMLEISEDFVQRSGNNLCSIFLLKVLCKRYGYYFLRVIVQDEKLKWIIPQNMQSAQSHEVDPFAIKGESYMAMKDQMSSMGKGGIQTLKKRLSSNNSDALKVEVLLSVYAQATQESQNAQLDRNRKRVFKDAISSTRLSKEAQDDFNHFIEMISESQPSGLMKLMKNQQYHEESWLISILIHFYAVMAVYGKHTKKLIPLAGLINCPVKLKECYLPGMPDDQRLKIQQFQQVQIEGWQKCRYGHPYFVDKCRRPWERDTCYCGAGIDEEPTDYLSKQTQLVLVGHILGKPEDRESELSVGPRTRPPIQVAVSRFMTHAAMLFASYRKAEDVTPAIQRDSNDSTLTNETVIDFLYGHLRKDICLLSKAAGQSMSHAQTILHIVLDEIVKLCDQQDDDSEAFSFDSSEGRAEWESKVMNSVLSPLTKDLERRLEDAIARTISASGLDGFSTLKMAFELEETDLTLSQPVCWTPVLWGYRIKPSLETVGRVIQGIEMDATEKHKYPVLSEFIDWECHLRVIRYLPGIIQLQKILKRAYHLKISKQDADEWPVSKFIDEYGPSNQNIEELVTNFCKAWKLLMFEEGLQKCLPHEFQMNNINDINPETTKLSAILPTKRGRGQCVLSLVKVIVDIQNRFLESCSRIIDVSNQKVKLSDVNAVNLIMYDPDIDLEQLLMLHSDYSLEFGKLTPFTYSLLSFERQVISSFIHGKALVEREDLSLEFLDSICDKTAFDRLRSSAAIIQKDLAPQIENDIISELRDQHSLPDLCTSLRNISLAINIISTSGGDKEQSIQDYLSDVLHLKSEDSVLCKQARKNCTLSHIKALWHILSVERAKQFLQSELDPFEDVCSDFKAPIPGIAEEDLQTYVPSINFHNGDLYMLVKVLYEFITLELKEGVQTEVKASESLRQHLGYYCNTLSAIQTLPGTVRVSQSVELWKKINDVHTDLEKKHLKF
ncbi:E3 ubiquitin-protein ligase rnf213-alpha-like [Ptychodera flava]|uniref:E3 ubiquitin-protein ligase rnf213-alpha-like n=1 Tax=Ptychodera flava TaxID=63121 RepID=UPI00396AA64D